MEREGGQRVARAIDIVNPLPSAQHPARFVQVSEDLIADFLLPVFLWGWPRVLQRQQKSNDHAGTRGNTSLRRLFIIAGNIGVARGIWPHVARLGLSRI